MRTCLNQPDFKLVSNKYIIRYILLTIIPGNTNPDSFILEKK